MEKEKMEKIFEGLSVYYEKEFIEEFDPDNFKEEIKSGKGRKEAIETAVRETSPSIISSALTFIVATMGVGFYSKMELVSVFGHMLARGALFSMFVILFILPSIIYFASPLIIKTTRGLKEVDRKENRKNEELIYE